MNLNNDAFGQAFWDYFHKRQRALVIERDDGYIDTSDTSVYFSTYDEWSPIEQVAMDYCKGRILDVGCGAGRHALYLQDKGFEVLGIDSSPLAIKVCKLRGLQKAEVLAIDAIDFTANSFETILMLGNNFGLFGSFENAQRLLRRFHSMTSDTGLLVTDTRDVYTTDNPDHVAYQTANRKRERMGGQITMRIRYRTYASPYFDYLMVSRNEMRAIVDGTGWTLKDTIDSEGSSYLAIIEKS
jgi:SAM-dependent methyltransferase